jgi:hypothetical protein
MGQNANATTQPAAGENKTPAALTTPATATAAPATTVAPDANATTQPAAGENKTPAADMVRVKLTDESPCGTLGVPIPDSSEVVTITAKESGIIPRSEFERLEDEYKLEIAEE